MKAFIKILSALIVAFVVLWLTFLQLGMFTSIKLRTKVMLLSPSEIQEGLDTGNYHIPNDTVLDGMNNTSLDNVFWRYINMIQTTCHHIQRIGSFLDGGKEMCTDDEFLPKQPCLVYSFGINYQWDFDEDVRDRFGCEVHCFDPSMEQRDHIHSEGIWFHSVGLGAFDRPRQNRSWGMKTLGTIRRDLEHVNRTLDILKVDIEGHEWASLLQAARTGDLVGVQQILVEVHWVFQKFQNRKESLQMLRALYDAGYRIAMRERNPGVPARYNWKRKSNFRFCVLELTFINPFTARELSPAT